MKKTIAIILARGGSKGIPHKNIKNFCGLPLIVPRSLAIFSSQWQLSFEQFQIIEVQRGLDALNQAGKDG